MRNRLVRFVAHVGKTKCFSAKLAVPGVDNEVMFFTKHLNHSDYIDVLVVRHASEGLRPKSLFGEEFETGSLDPIVNEPVGSGVAGVARVEPFLENFIELRLEGEDVTNARRGRRHRGFLLFFEFEEVEVVTAILLLPGAVESFLGN